MLQLRLLDLTQTEEVPVPIEERARTELVELMARILVVVFQAEGRKANDRTSVQ